MNPQINRLVKSLLKKESLEQCSLQELEQFAERHPYFGAAQLLLTKKLQAEKSERYDEQLQKTFLFFNNPLWVQHLLNETGSGEIILSDENKETAIVEEMVLPAQEAIVKQEAGTSESSDINKIHHIQEVNLVDVVYEPDPGEPLPQEPQVKTEPLQITPAEEIKTDLVFEPYHTVDYFASQGIRFKEEEKPADKFSQQLKSFTDWLKTMKRLPVTEIAKSGASPLEKKVEQLAEHSLAEKEVLTEAMAEVWEKQGNTVKATEIYTKLSLLDPSKNLYFAAKIEALKKKN